MKGTRHIPQEGSWVHSYSPGIWQVYRIVRGFFELRYSLEEPRRVSKRVLVQAKRLFDEGWKPAFAAESCDAGFISPLTEEEKSCLLQRCKEDDEICKAFQHYTPPPQDFLCNIGVKGEAGFQKLVGRLRTAFRDIENGITNTDLLRRLADAGIEQTPLTGLTLQFRCRDHELRDNEFVFRSVEVLNV